MQAKRFLGEAAFPVFLFEVPNQPRRPREGGNAVEGIASGVPIRFCCLAKPGNAGRLRKVQSDMCRLDRRSGGRIDEPLGAGPRINWGRLAQLVRAPARQAGGHRFESRIAHSNRLEKAGKRRVFRHFRFLVASFAGVYEGLLHLTPGGSRAGLAGGALSGRCRTGYRLRPVRQSASNLTPLCEQRSAPLSTPIFSEHPS